MPIVNLLSADGRISRSAVILDAKRQYRVMGRHGWDWPECLRYSWRRALALQHQRDAARMEADLCGPENDPE